MLLWRNICAKRADCPGGFSHAHCGARAGPPLCYCVTFCVLPASYRALVLLWRHICAILALYLRYYGVIFALNVQTAREASRMRTAVPGLALPCAIVPVLLYSRYCCAIMASYLH